MDKKTLESIIEVDYSNKEIIVIDDGSTDNTYFIASNIMKKRARILGIQVCIQGLFFPFKITF